MNARHQIEPELQNLPPRVVYARQSARSLRFFQMFLVPFVLAGLFIVTKEEYESASIGDELTILYNPRKPRCNVNYCHGGYRVG